APVVLNSRMPESLVRRYAALQHEHRRGEIATLPSAAYAPAADPSAEQLQAYYQANRSDYIRPERRILRYAAYGEEALTADITPTDAEIAARYERDIDLYRAAELRNLETLIVPLASGQAEANAIRAEVVAGKSLDQAARERGLSVNRSQPMEQDDVASRDSAAVAAAAFATPQGGLTQPVRGRLGFYIVRVAGIEQKAGRSIAQVRDEIVDQLTTEKRRAALLDLSASIEDSINDGANLVEIADAFGLTIQSTPPIIGTGQVYGNSQAAVPPGLMPIVPTAFALEEGQAQIDELLTGTTFIVYDVGDIINSAPAPLSEIEATVKLAWKQTEGLKAARAAADRIAARLDEGQTLAAALAEEKVPLPAITPVDMNRSELSDMQRVAAPLALLFSMAEGTVKKLELGNKAGWVVTKLDDIEVGELAENDPELVRVGDQLHRILANEQAWSFTRAVKEDVGVELNDSTIEVLKSQLGGTGS
ncbi:MAG TPA: peptidyl-prolyl cis-trans isomerase, partial [Sphingomonadaceae bacterium]|nr:peptidyl-prolyl cis-trans isomerase [Sphingomonadaceae bacterium]